VTTLLHAALYMFLHKLLDLLVQIANKKGLQRKYLRSSPVVVKYTAILTLLPTNCKPPSSLFNPG
jgi:hypothetical protein